MITLIVLTIIALIIITVCLYAFVGAVGLLIDISTVIVAALIIGLILKAIFGNKES